MTVVAVITQAFGRYCLESLNPAFAHIWVMVIEGLCVTLAMYCIIQFYVQLKEDLAENRPLLKVTAIKLVIFLSFWQTILISFLTSSGAVKPSKKFDFPDIKVGIPSMLLCIEMAIFSIFHLWAFPWKVYDVRRSPIVAAESAAGFLPDPKTAYQGGKFGQKALMDAFNPWDLIKAVGRGFRWFVVGRRTREQDISYKTHLQDNVNLEPARASDPASSAYRPSHSFEDTHPLDPYAPTSTTNIGGVPLKKPRHYRALSGHDDERNDHHGLLSHAQPNPSSPPSKASLNSYAERGIIDNEEAHNESNDTLSYPRPMIRYPTPPSSKKKPQRLSGGDQGGGGGDIGAPGFYADENSSHPQIPQPQVSASSQLYAPQHLPPANHDRRSSRERSNSPLGREDHGRESSFEGQRMKTPPPAPAYLYSTDPADITEHPSDQRQANDRGEWDVWGGVSGGDGRGRGGGGRVI